MSVLLNDEFTKNLIGGFVGGEGWSITCIICSTLGSIVHLHVCSYLLKEVSLNTRWHHTSDEALLINYCSKFWRSRNSILFKLADTFIGFNYYRPQRSCDKVIFSQASVILSTGGAGCVSQNGLGQTPPPQADRGYVSQHTLGQTSPKRPPFGGQLRSERTPLGRHPWADTSQADTPQADTPRADTPQATPPLTAAAASYWNAFLFWISLVFLSRTLDLSFPGLLYAWTMNKI